MNALRNPNLVLILVGRFLSSFGDSLFLIALPWYSITVLHSPEDLMLTGVVLTLPRIFGLFVGVFVDRWNKRVVLIGTDLARFGLAASLFLVLFSPYRPFFLVLLLVFAINSLGTLFFPALSAYFTVIVPADELPSASSFHHSVESAGRIGGMLSGGILIAASGIPLLFLLDAISFVVSALSIIFVSVKGFGSPPKTRQRYWVELANGYRFIVASWPILRIIIAVAITNFTLSPFDIVLAYYVRHRLDGTSVAFGVISATLIVGDILGSSLIGLVAKRVNINAVVKFGLIALGVVLASVGADHHFVEVVGSVFLAGIMIGAVSGSIIGLLFQHIPRQLMGRVRAPLGAISSLGMPAGMFVFGSLLDVLPAAGIFAIMGCLSVLSGLSFLIRPSATKEANDIPI